MWPLSDHHDQGALSSPGSKDLCQQMCLTGAPGIGQSPQDVTPVPAASHPRRVVPASCYQVQCLAVAPTAPCLLIRPIVVGTQGLTHPTPSHAAYSCLLKDSTQPVPTCTQQCTQHSPSPGPQHGNGPQPGFPGNLHCSCVAPQGAWRCRELSQQCCLGELPRAPQVRVGATRSTAWAPWVRGSRQVPSSTMTSAPEW